MVSQEDLREWLGDLDIYLFDQLQRGRIPPGTRILDAGCGGGRNVLYFLRAGYPVCAVDASEEAMAKVRALAARFAPHRPPTCFPRADLRDLPFPAASFDLVISNAVLHFAEDEGAFHAMLAELCRVLTRGGRLFCRLAAKTGIEDRVRPLGNGRYELPDGSRRFLVDEALLERVMALLDLRLTDVLKTTLVHGKRAMTTWCVEKGDSGRGRPGGGARDAGPGPA